MTIGEVFSIILSILFVLNIVFAGIIIFLERRDATSTWAWVMVLFFIPFLGFILYLIFGQNLTRRRLFDWEDIKKIGIEDLIRAQIAALREERFHFIDPSVREHRDLIFMQLVNNDSVLTQENEVDIFIDGGKKFEALMKDIEAAEAHIHFQYYILRDDKLGTRIIKALTKKAEEGVKVRILYDEMGSRSISKKSFRAFHAAGGETSIFFPRRIPFINLRLNYRNHRKIVIIDGQIGYTGGFNVGDEYLGLDAKFGYWRDTHLRMLGDAVKALQTRFILDWNQASPDKRDIHYQEGLFPAVDPHAGNTAVQIVSSGPDSQWEQIKNGYIKMILMAKESVYIQTPYFIPDQSLMDALRIAALSGVDVRIMIPNKPDHPFVYWATYSHIGTILEAGAEVYIYDNGFIHAKTIVVDGKVSSVGTANIDNRSFALNFEVNAFIYHHPFSQRMALIFEEDMKQSTRFTLNNYKKRSLWIRFKEAIAHLLSPIL